MALNPGPGWRRAGHRKAFLPGFMVAFSKKRPGNRTERPRSATGAPATTAHARQPRHTDHILRMRPLPAPGPGEGPRVRKTRVAAGPVLPVQRHAHLRNRPDSPGDRAGASALPVPVLLVAPDHRAAQSLLLSLPALPGAPHALPRLAAHHPVPGLSGDRDSLPGAARALQARHTRVIFAGSLHPARLAFPVVFPRTALYMLYIIRCSRSTWGSGARAGSSASSASSPCWCSSNRHVPGQLHRRRPGALPGAASSTCSSISALPGHADVPAVLRRAQKRIRKKRYEKTCSGGSTPTPCANALPS